MTGFELLVFIIGIVEGLLSGILIQQILIVRQIKKKGYYETKNFKYYRTDKRVENK